MKRWRLLSLAAVVALLAILFFAQPSGPKEPVYQGKKLSRWMREAYEDAHNGTAKYSREERDAARAALRAMGTNAVPYLLSEFARAPSPRRMQLNRWLYRQKFERFRFETGELRRDLATLSLRWLGPDASPALPVLVPQLARERIGQEAAYALSQCMASTVPEVVRYYSTNASQLNLVLSRLVLNVGAYEEEFAHIVALMNHTNASVRRATAASLRFAKNHPGMAVKALSRAQSDPDSQVRDNAAEALKYLGDAGKPSNEHLQRMLKDRDPNIATFASNVLLRMDPGLPSNPPGNE